MDDLNNIVKLNSGRKKIFRMIVPCYPAFNIYSTVARETTALGSIMIATIVNMIPGWEAEIIDENNYYWRGGLNDMGKPDHDLLERMRPADVVGLYGGLTSTIPRLYELAAFYKAHGVTTVSGGQHFIEDNIAEALDNNVDYVIIGEGEETIRELLEALDACGKLDKINGLAFRDGEHIVETPLREPIKDLDSLPLPDFSMLRHAKIKLFPVSLTRGCGMNCEFCTVKGKVRLGTVDYAFQQFTSVYERFNGDYFFIVDDLFGQDRKMAIELCHRLKAYQEAMSVRFWITAQIRLDRAKDTELLKAMRSAGINLVAIGYESPIPDELKSMNKKLNPEEIINLTNIFHRMGFLVHGMFIFGYPIKPNQKFTLDAKERIKIFSRFIRKAKIDTIQILLPVPLPGTEMTRRLKDDNRILSKDLIGWEYYDGSFPLFIPDEPMTVHSMYMSFKNLMSGFYRFRYLFAMILNIICFPVIIFSIFNLRRGWTSWHMAWRNNMWRFVGWYILRKWSASFENDDFLARLSLAEKELDPQSDKE